MKNRYWIIGVAFMLIAAAGAHGNEGGTNKTSAVLSKPADEKKTSGPGQSLSDPVTIGFIANITTDGVNLFAVNTYNHTIQKIIISTGEVSTFAGLSGVSGASDGFGSGALFNYPQGITTDGTNLYIADTGNCVIRKVVISTGEVTTLAGTTGKCGSADGSGAAAQFGAPYGITTVGASLYVVETNNGSIRKIDIPSGVVTTVVGSTKTKGSSEGHETAEGFKHPTAITSDGTSLYVVDNDGKVIRKVVIATGALTTLAGAPGVLGSTDGIGPAALFGVSYGIATDGKNLYVADTYNASIRKIVISTGEVSTLAGRAGALGFDDGRGAAARFNMVAGITIDGNNLYVVNNGNNVIRKIVIASGEVTTLPNKAVATGSAGAADSAR